MKKVLFALLAVVLFLGFGAICVWEYITSPYEGDGAAWVFLPRGTDRAALGDSLRSALGERMGSRAFLIYKAAAKDSVPIYGAYKIEPGTSAKDIARRILRHRQSPVRLTFNNVRTLSQLAERVGRQMAFSDAAFLAAMDSLLPASGFSSKAQFPAAFLPDTYEVYWTDSPEVTVERLLKVRNDFWTPERRSKAAALGLTPVQVATLASIAEEETNAREERPTIARLYLNRLRKGMKLQADPTVKFALGDFGLRRIRAEHLKAPSPYNTYLHAGLPPGPIRIPTARTLDGILDSRPNPYIYICAKEDFSGTHNFATDYATHLANARKYRKALDARGI